MFRKPRDSANGIAEQLGRPPSPSVAAQARLPPSPAPAALRSKDMASRTSKPPVAGSNNVRRVQTTPKAKGKDSKAARPNGSILNFFKKANPSEHSRTNLDYGDDLFIPDASYTSENEPPAQVPTPPKDDEPFLNANEETRYNEMGGTVKRRKTGAQLLGRSFSPVQEIRDTEEERIKETEAVMDCTEPNPSETDQLSSSKNLRNETASEPGSRTPEKNHSEREPGEELRHMRTATPSEIPSLTRESTSAMFQEDDEYDNFFDDEEALAELGEEFLERRYAEEQARLESETNQDEDALVTTESTFEQDEIQEPSILDSDAPPCPICNIALAGITAEQASTHVNNCLDGRPSSLPTPKIKPPGVKPEPPPPAKRFMKAAIARPGQQNPIQLGGEVSTSDKSAFSKLMSGHAEDTAWAAAAAHEVASRGKPAFKRTCPFYKILPGFSVCVDAFRYGAVQGCSAYFLSHFHSDHYIGLTSSWCHGPIYCSKVTANLVKQQLRVDKKYVVALEFEQKVEVPGTNGVHVTMIPANHCPGSSLFLYEKAVSKAPNSKLQRILHCGDFRACPAHVQHPLLRPDVIDAVSGKRREQKLNVCYLDTTYCTPKYAFPLQHEVIQACADMCVSLSKEHLDENDNWEKVKKARAGAGMVKFTQNGPSTTGEHEKELDEDGNVVATGRELPGKTRGRLLVIVGTYSIGKERICLGIAKALNSKIYATSGKQRICAALEDPELTSRLTSDPLEAQVHMQMIMEIRPETLADYLASYKPHFSRIVGFRPSGWNYRPPNSRFTDSPLVQTVLHSDNWKSRYTMHELMPQRGSTREASCFGVPYSEHSSFRELSMFCCALRIDKIIPTVNIGSAKSREKMKGWFEKWDQEKKKNGLFKIADDATTW